MNKEKLTEKLIENYISICHKKNHFKVAASKNKDHKNYKYFEKAIEMYGNVPDFDPFVFVEANLIDQIRFPAQLATKIAFSRFRDYKDRLQVSVSFNKEDTLIEAFENTKEIIIAKIGKYDPETFFGSTDPDMSPGLAMFLKGLISVYYCMVCKPFWAKIKILAGDLTQMIDFEDLKTKRAFILNLSTAMKKKLKKIIGNEFWV